MICSNRYKPDYPLEESKMCLKLFWKIWIKPETTTVLPLCSQWLYIVQSTPMQNGQLSRVAELSKVFGFLARPAFQKDIFCPHKMFCWKLVQIQMVSDRHQRGEPGLVTLACVHFVYLCTCICLCVLLWGAKYLLQTLPASYACLRTLAHVSV